MRPFSKPEYVVAVVIMAGHGDHDTKAQSNGEEVLWQSIKPNLKKVKITWKKKELLKIKLLKVSGYNKCSEKNILF